MSSLQEKSALALSRGSAYPAIEWEKRWINWDEMRQVADAVNALIDDSGTDPQAPIAMLPRNHPAAVAALLGLVARGRNVRMIHVYQSPAGISRDIIRLKPAVVLGADKDLSEDVRSVMREHGIAGVALTGMGAAAVPGCERSTAACDPPPPTPRIDVLTSGTTGAPKQFPFTYDMIEKHFVANAWNTAQQIDPLSLPPVYMYLSCSTITGLYLALPTMLNGLRGVMVDRFTVPSWHDYVVRYRPQSCALPPPAVQMVLDANLPPADLASVRSVLVGAAPLDPNVQRAFEERFGVPILQMYGATEFGGPVTFMTLELRQEWGSKKVGSVGRPYAGAELRAIDPETGAAVPPGQEGLLEVKTPRMGPDWIRTSDMGVIDEDGFVFIHGRADGAIIRGGFKLLPDAIERALKLHEAVSVAGVTGISDKRLGQAPAAAIQLKPAAAMPTIAELEAHLRDHVPATHIPVVWRFVDTLPYSAMMKVDRVALRKLFENGEANQPAPPAGQAPTAAATVTATSPGKP
jgi:acyl-CoA synthetase (AMP-forming)/AMP-acid ligase II